MTKMTETIKKKIFELHKAGVSNRKIAKEVGFSHVTVGNVLKASKNGKKKESGKLPLLKPTPPTPKRTPIMARAASPPPRQAVSVSTVSQEQLLTLQKGFQQEVEMLRALQQIPLKKEDQEALLRSAKEEGVPAEDLLGAALTFILGVKEGRREFLNNMLLYSLLEEHRLEAKPVKPYRKFKPKDIRPQAIERMGSKEVFEATLKQFRGWDVVVRDNDRSLLEEEETQAAFVGKIARRDVFLPHRFPLRADSLKKREKTGDEGE
ncbi:MAG: helix-turn-helix domain-containing protein [Candidatus Heimdallarchaeota archaeon]